MVDILFVAHGRHEFTRASLKALLKNTPEVKWDWRSGNPTLSIYTDHDADPSYCFSKAMRKDGPPIWRVNNEKHGGPVACLNDFIWKTDPKSPNEYDDQPRRPPEATPEFIAKIDNDTIVPPGWLPACLDLMRRYPNVDLLGIEPWTPDEKLFPNWVEPMRMKCSTCGEGSGNILPHCPECKLPYDPMRPLPAWPQALTPRPVSHIGGIGVFRRSAFERFGRPVPNSQDGRYGFTEWQWQNPAMVKAFIDPPLPVFLLDHLPFEPWVSLSAKYEGEGVQRNVGWRYDEVKHAALWSWAFASGGVLSAEKLDVGGNRP